MIGILILPILFSIDGVWLVVPFAEASGIQLVKREEIEEGGGSLCLNWIQYV